MKRSLMVLMTSFLSLCIAYPAISATIFSESTDVGDQISTAQVIGNFSSGDLLTGSLSGNASNADLFRINLTAGSTFTASVSNPFFDTQLFLFDASGRGLTGNDNVANSSGGVTDLNAVFTYTPTITGTYYLAISGYDFDPKDSAGNFLFSNNLIGNFTLVSDAILSSWAENNISDFGLESGNYQITLSFTEASAVPEPSILPGLLALAGGLGMGIFKRKQLA
jgi:hypothetical protein